MEESQTGTVVAVYVRRCGDRQEECRELSFRIPDGVSQTDILDEGFAIDGNSATQAVTPYYDQGEYVPLADALLYRQRSLVKWFAERSYEVQFK